MPGKKKFLLVLSTAACAFSVAAEGATATTFCVPTAAACPGGSGVAKTDLEEAMGADGKDGLADTVYLAAGTFTEDGSYEPSSGFKNPGTIEPAGTDALTVIGAGTSTVVTSSGSGNIFLMALGSANRAITVRELILRVPASFTDNQGAALQLLEDDKLEDAQIVSRNPDSDAVVASGDDVVRNVFMRGESGGTIDSGVTASFGGQVTVEDSRMEGSSWALYVNGENAELTARRVTEVGTRTYGGVATAGTLRVENSLFTVEDGIGLYASASEKDATVEADQVTIANSGGTTYPAMELKRFGGGAGDMSIDVSNSILRGFDSGYQIDTVLGPGIGTATLGVRYSNFQNTGNSNGSLDLTTGNIDVDPLFLGDYSLPANSPSVDAGDPAAGGLATDFLGAPRPADGDGDGLAVRDQGAFEYQPPIPPGGGGGAGGTSGGGGTASGGNGAGEGKDAAAPQTTIAKGPGSKLPQGKAKFAFRSSEKGSSFACKLDKRKAKPCNSPKTYKGLAPGRHTFKVWATDAAGNKDSTPAKRRFKVPA